MLVDVNKNMNIKKQKAMEYIRSYNSIFIAYYILQKIYQ